MKPVRTALVGVGGFGATHLEMAHTLAEEGLLRVRLGKKARIAAPATTGHMLLPADEYPLRIRELVVDGLLQGWSTDQLHQILDQEIGVMSERGAMFTSMDEGKDES